MDVESLYTNVPFRGGLEAIEFFLDQRPCQVPSTASLRDLAKLVLSHNYFLFGLDYYLLISGVSMGSKMAPSFASLFCGMFKHRFVINPGSNDFWRHIVLWKRYIDDVILIWSGTESELLEFHSLVNNKCSALKFTIEFHQEKIIFLDVLVCCTASALELLCSANLLTVTLSCTDNRTILYH